MAFRTCRDVLRPAMALAAMMLAGPFAQAAVVVDGTRVVYPSDRRDVSVNIHNVGEIPALIEVWIDAGNDRSRPDEATTPFVATPPLFRLNPAQGQTLRLVYTQAALPADRESVFWLNVLDIPPRAKADPDAPNHLEMAFRHRLKIFFRPIGLHGDPADAAKAVVWTIVTGPGGPALVARNPTPFYISLISADIAAGGVNDHARTEMVPPKSAVRFALSQPAWVQSAPHRRVTVHYSFINDFGAVMTGDSAADIAP